MVRWFAFVIVFVGACAGEDGSSIGDPVVVRDSAGIRIVENTSPSHGYNVWQLSTEPTVTIGAVESGEDHQLYVVNGATRLDNGTIVVANGGSYQLKYYDASGRFVVNAGRQGEGPGEFAGFRAPFRVWQSDDGDVVAWEHGPARMSIFDVEGQFVESRSIVQEPPFSPMPVGTLKDGRIIAYHPSQEFYDTPDAPVGTVARDTMRFVWLSSDGSDSDEIAPLPGFEHQVTESRGRRVWGGQPFGKPPVFAVSPGLLYHGSANTYELVGYQPDGTVSRFVRRTERDRRLTSQIIDAHVSERMRAAPEDPNSRREWQRAFDEMQWPDSVPAYSRIRVDRVENLWVRNYRLPGETERNWSVFSPDGIWLTDVATPSDLNVYEIGDDYVLGLWRNEDDVEHVLMYELTKN